MRFLRLLVAAGCVSLLSARSYALSSSWPADDITNPDGRLDVAVGGDIEHLTDVASDGYYGVLIGWENAADDRVYAQRIDPTGAERWTGMVKWTDVDWSAVESAAWLTAGTLAGTIDPASADGIVVTVDPVSLGTVGPQTGIIEISDDAAGMRTAVLAAVVYIYSGAPETDALEFVPGRVEFETLSGSTTARNQTVWLSVSGTVDVDWTAVIDAASTGWLSMDTMTGTITPGTNEDILVTADPSTLADGIYTGVVTVTDDTDTARGAVLVVTLYVGPPGSDALAVKPRRLEFRAVQNDVATQNATVMVTGPSVSVFKGAATQTQAAVTGDLLRGGYCAWTDTRDGVGPPNGAIYLQHLDRDGDHVGIFGKMDILVSEDAIVPRGKLTFTDGDMVVTGTNTVFTAELGTDYIIRPENSATWYTVASVTDDYSLTLTGLVAPADAGVDVYATVVPYPTTDFSECHSPKLLANSDGCYVAYLNDSLALTADVAGANRKVPLLQLAYVDKEGERLWTTDIDFPHPDTEYQLHADGEDGIIVVWHVPPYVDEGRPLKEPGASFAVRIDASGEGVWGDDPVLLFRRGRTTAEVSYDESRGELWVSGPWTFVDENLPREADDGHYAVVNKLLPTGNWAWGEWTKAFEWDSREKGRANAYTAPEFDNFDTQQLPVGVAGDGAGGVYALVKDDRKTGAQHFNAPALIPGTMTFTQGSTDVTGTVFADFYGPDDVLGGGDDTATAGDLIGLDAAGVWVQIQSVDSDTSLTLVMDYPGASGAGLGSVTATTSAVGTLTLISSSDQVAGSGFYGIDGLLGGGDDLVSVGDLVALDAAGVWVRVQSVDSDVLLTLTVAYPAIGGTGAGSVATALQALTFSVAFTNGSNQVTGAGTFQTSVNLGFVTSANGFPFWNEQYVRVGTNMRWYKVASIPAQNRLLLDEPYIGPDVTGQGYVTGNLGWYHDPYRNIYGSHVDPTGKTVWRSGDDTVNWNDDDAFKYATISADGTIRWLDYPWVEGRTVVWNPTGSVKDYVRNICDPWPGYNPVPGDTLASSLTSVWVEDYESEYPAAEDVRYDAIRCTQLCWLGSAEDWMYYASERMTTLDVYNGLADVPAADFRIRMISDERYGVTVVWEQVDPPGTDGNIYAKHFNYYQMYYDERVDPIGIGPDIFAPPPVSSFTADGGIGDVTLTWTNPPGGTKPLNDFAGVMVRRSTETYPATEVLGDWVYEGPLEEYVDTDVQSGLTYYYSVFTWDTELGIRNFSGPVKKKAVVDFDDVQNFEAYGSGTTVELTWDNPGGTRYAGVLILRNTTDYPPAYSDSLSATVGNFTSVENSYTDTGLEPGIIYYYTAFAYDDSDPVRYADGVTAFAVPLLGVTVDQVTAEDQQVNLDLTIPTEAVNGFVDVVIRRSTTGYPATETDGDEAAVIDAPDPGVPPQTTVSYVFSDASVENYTVYYYSVFAHYSFGEPINRDIYTAPTTAQVTPGDFTAPDVITLSATSGEDRQVTLSWTNPPYLEDWTKIVIRRSETSGSLTDSSSGTGVETYDRPLVDDPATPEYDPDYGDPTFDAQLDDLNVTNGVTYYYVLFVMDENDNEAGSVEAPATPIDVTSPDMPTFNVLAVINTPGGIQQPAIRVTWSVDVTVAPNLDVAAADTPIVVLRANWDEDNLPAAPYPSGPTDDRDNVKNLAAELDVAGAGTVDDTTVVPGVTYYYAAWIQDDESPANVSLRAEASVTAVDNFPPAISNVVPTPSVTATFDHKADLTWMVRDIDPTSYRIDFGTVTVGTTRYYYLGSFEDTTEVPGPAYTAAATIDNPPDGLWGGTPFNFKITVTDSKGAYEDHEGTFTTLFGAGEDTDSDGIADAWELLHFVDLDVADAASDTDADGLIDLEEYYHQTDPNNEDTDGDGVKDNEEIAVGSDPRKAPKPPIGFDEGCGAAPGTAPLAAALAALALAFGALRRRTED